MIDRHEILDISKTLGLLPNVVEKDYVLSWTLAGLYQQTVLSKNWIFKVRPTATSETGNCSLATAGCVVGSWHPSR